jgi:hypothetical protein
VAKPKRVRDKRDVKPGDFVLFRHFNDEVWTIRQVSGVGRKGDSSIRFEDLVMDSFFYKGMFTIYLLSLEEVLVVANSLYRENRDLRKHVEEIRSIVKRGAKRPDPKQRLSESIDMG